MIKRKANMNNKMKDAIKDTDKLFGTMTDQENIQQAFDASKKVGNGVIDFILNMLVGWLYGTCLTIMMVFVQPFKDLAKRFTSDAIIVEEPKGRAMTLK